MARPKVFISSTYYDLKYIRANLEGFINSMGYDPVLSEKGNIAFAPDVPLDESCYREVKDSDILILIIGGRYGSEKSKTKNGNKKDFYDRYDSITKEELNNAIKNDIPIYILIEKNVYSDYENYVLNKDNDKIKYAHVDSINIFELIDQILSLKRNNPIFQFDKYTDIENWLREQWSGLFRELLKRIKIQKEISSLNVEVTNLSEINETLKKYLERIIIHLEPSESKKLIEKEEDRLKEVRELSAIEATDYGESFPKLWNINHKDIIKITKESTTLNEMINKFIKKSSNKVKLSNAFKNVLSDDNFRIMTFKQLNELREALDLAPLDYNYQFGSDKK